MSSKTILIVADPLQNLLPGSDTGLAILRGALAKGYRGLWCTPQDLFINNHDLWARVTPCLDAPLSRAPQVESTQTIFLAESVDAVFIRKDPPVDDVYQSMCWFLGLLKDKVPVFNDPQLLLRYNEKLLPTEAYTQGYLKKNELLPTGIGIGHATWNDYAPPIANEGKALITKPLDGYAGHGVQKWGTLQEVDLSSQSAQLIAQPFMEGIQKNGDRRVLYIDGKRVGDFCRVPAPGGFLANLAQGGHAELRGMSPSEKALCDRIEPFIKKLGFSLVGLDLIEGRLTEMNVTAPTGFATLHEIGGPDLSSRYLESVFN